MFILIIFLIILLSIIFVLLFFYKRENLLLSNLEKIDSYIQKHHQHIFVNEFDENNIGYIVPYHNQDISKMKKWKEKLKNRFIILLDGEPNPIDKIEADIIITTKLNFKSNIPYIYMPAFVFHFIQSNLSAKLLLKNKNEEIIEKKKFCCFIYSNCDEKYKGVVNRKKFLFEMKNRFKNRIDNLGKCYNTNYKKNGYWQNNANIYQDYKFVICFENEYINGYVTEKIWIPMIHRSIPIYLGAPNITEYFNPKSFINVNDFKNFSECIDYIDKVDKDFDLYSKIQKEPYFYNNKIDSKVFSYYFGGEFFEKFSNNLPKSISKYIRPCMFYKETIYFTTYSIEKEKPKIFEIAKKTGFFKNFSHFSSYNKLVPELILKMLNFIKDNDVVFFINPEFKISKLTIENFSNYYKMILKDNYDVILFNNYPKLIIIRKSIKILNCVNKAIINNLFENYLNNCELKIYKTNH